MPNRAFALDDLALVELAGEDRLEWLQGQATNDVRGLTPGGRVSFCLCEPTGQILAILDAWAFEDRILMSTARERVAAVLDRVESMTILEDVSARALPFRGVWSSEWIGDDALALPSTLGGYEVWTSEAEVKALLAQMEAVDGESMRLMAGVPKWGRDAGPRTLPAELGPAFEARHVSYAKGCYTGQEVLMRMHTRGHTNRTWVGLVAREPLEVGATVTFEGKEVGKVSSAALSPHPSPAPPEGSGAFLAAATLRNEAVVDGTRVLVDGFEAEVRPMPLVDPS